MVSVRKLAAVLRDAGVVDEETGDYLVSLKAATRALGMRGRIPPWLQRPALREMEIHGVLIRVNNRLLRVFREPQE